jgi:choline dehydrogenase-like flavoprotein
VLALHALLTPALLLRSANELFPDGLGNSSGMVGRNLMFHVLDSLLVHFNDLHGQPNALLNHGLALNDFYTRDGVKLGNIQAHAANLGQFLGEDTLASKAHFFTILEDFPYMTNRVMPKRGGDDGVCWEYRHSDELEFRRDMLTNAFVAALRPIRTVEERRGSLNIPHACGTCRFGADPHTSVLDRDNRIHDLDNAYVLDASFFPSSGGMNPSLTIVANSLRVSALIAKR